MTQHKSCKATSALRVRRNAADLWQGICPCAGLKPLPHRCIEGRHSCLVAARHAQRLPSRVEHGGFVPVLHWLILWHTDAQALTQEQT